MKLTIAYFLALAGVVDSAFVPHRSSPRRCSVAVRGYLDDLQAELKAGSNDLTEEDLKAQDRELTKMDKEQIDRFGPGSLQDFVDFADEFDGGDGQMGVAGDGNKQLEKMGNSPSFAKSQARSAKNAWGTETGYAEDLRKRGVDTQKAQRLENWQNQQEIRRKNLERRKFEQEFDQVDHDEDWRTLAKFGVERNQDFDMSEEFGAVTAGQIDGVIEISSPLGQGRIYEFELANQFMGFADFRAAFTPDSPVAWSVTPNEGALSKEATKFIVRFKPEQLGVCEGLLVIETEDFKKTWQCIGTTG